VNRKLVDKADALLRKEKGTIFKDPGGRISVCLAYPNTYHVGMSNLGLQGIYALLNARDDVVCERVFLPDDSDMAEYLRTGTSLFSLESKRAFADFDIVAFSVSFENDYPNILRMLGMSRIPFETSERNSYHPLVIAGGVCVSFNPEPLAPLFDVIFVGEAEETIGQFMDEYKKACSRADALDRAASVRSVYVPSKYEISYNGAGCIAGRRAMEGAPDIIIKSYAGDLSAAPFNTSVITTETEFAEMYLVEVMRGCPWNCRFCLAGNFFGPLRMKPAEQVKVEIEEGKKKACKIGLIGPSLTDYEGLREILGIAGVQFSITSLRAGGRSAELVGHISGHKSVSIAPEAGTERLRKTLNKQVTEDEILQTVELLRGTDIETLRLYFMIGLPTETGEDIDGIIALCRKARAIDKTKKLVLSVSPFVPKPFTPFQWSAMAGLDILKTRIRRLKKTLEKEGMKIFHDTPKHAHMQGLFSLGDRRVFRALEQMTHADDYVSACRDAKIDPAYYIFREKTPDEKLPWDFIDAGVKKERLWNEYQKAIEEGISLKPFSGK
jgi:radical SAM superfamily enzyme YgiQ (UPF0313 family)